MSHANQLVPNAGHNPHNPSGMEGAKTQGLHPMWKRGKMDGRANERGRQSRQNPRPTPTAVYGGINPPLG